MPTDYFPTNFSRVWLRGRFVDLGKAARGERKIGYYGVPITFTPDAKTLTDQETMQIMVVPTFSATPEIVNGYWQVLLPATNDPDVNPINWTYFVQEPTGRHYNIEVPYDTPVLHDASDPLDEQRVIELSDISPASSGSGGTIQLLQGRGISSMAIVGGDLIVTFSDEVESNLGPLPVWAINQASDYDSSPAPTDGQFLAYNSGTSKWEPTTLDTVTTFDGSAITSGTVPYGRLPVGTTTNTVAAGDDTRMTDSRNPLPHSHAASDVASGTLAINRLPTGTSGTTVAFGNHTHSAGDITSGTVPFAQLPAGSGSTQVAIGNHSHAFTDLSGTVPVSDLPVGTTASTVAAGNHTHSGSSPVTLTYAATTNTDASLGSYFRLTLTGNTTLANPTNPTDGQRVMWELIQDATGSRTVAFGSAFAFGSDINSFTATTTANKRDFVGAVYNATAAKWFVVAAVKGY